MKLHDPTLIAALIDGQLKGWRRWLVQRHAAKCPTCAVEYREQHHARDLLRNNPPRDVMSDSPDFFWSKVRNEIQRHGPEEISLPEPRLTLADWLREHPAALATVTVAIVALLGAIGLIQFRSKPVAVPVVASSTVEKVTTTVPQASATAFHSADADATVIWVTGLPWTPNMTQMQTLYASLDS